MANFNVTTKVIIHNGPNDSADSVTGSYAKVVNDYIQTVDDGKTIRSIHAVYLPNSNCVMTTIVHDS